MTVLPWPIAVCILSSPRLSGWMAASLIVPAALTTAAIWYHCRTSLAISHFVRIVEKAEACFAGNPEAAQRAFGLAADRLRPIQQALADRCRCQGMDERLLYYLSKPEPLRLRNVAQDALSRAEFGIAMSLFSREATARRHLGTLSASQTLHLASSRMAAQGAEQFLANMRDEAICHLKAAVSLAPNRGQYWYTLGRACELAKRDEESVVAIQRAIALDPRVEEYYEILVRVAWKTRAYRLYNQGLLGIVETSGRCRGNL